MLAKPISEEEEFLDMDRRALDEEVQYPRLKPPALAVEIPSPLGHRPSPILQFSRTTSITIDTDRGQTSKIKYVRAEVIMIPLDSSSCTEEATGSSSGIVITKAE